MELILGHGPAETAAVQTKRVVSEIFININKIIRTFEPRVVLPSGGTASLHGVVGYHARFTRVRS